MQCSPINKCKGVGNGTVGSINQIRRNEEAESLLLAISYLNRFVRCNEQSAGFALFIVRSQEAKQYPIYRMFAHNVLANAECFRAIKEIDPGTVSSIGILQADQDFPRQHLYLKRICL